MNIASHRCASFRRHLRGLARVATVLVAGLGLGLGLGGCSPFFDSEVVVALGTPRLVPAEVSIPAEAVAGAAPIRFRIELPYRYTNQQSSNRSGRMTLAVVGGLPAGLQLKPGAGVLSTEPLLVDDRLIGRNEAGLSTYELELLVSSTAAIGGISPGRHAVPMRAELCVENVVDLSVGDGSTTVCDARTTELVIVIGGAAAPQAPAGLAATPGLRDVRLNWSADPAPDSYRLERALTGAAFATVATLAAPITTHQDSGLDPATRYTYRLTPSNAAGSGPAATIEVQTLAETGNGLLAAAVAGSGAGRVSSVPAGIDCPDDCSQSYPLGSSVTLTAVPAVGSVFDGWSGPADCADGVVTVVAELACTAGFSPAPAGGRGWALIGELLASGGEAPLIAPQRSGDLHVALRRVDATSAFRELVVMRRSGDQVWTALAGGAPNGIASAGSHGFVVDPAGRPLVAWTEAAAVRVARHENGVWTRLAENLRIGSGTPVQVQLEWRDAQPPVLSWIEVDGGIHRLAVKRLSGDPALGDAAWVGGFLPDITNLRGHRMALDSNGLPSFVVSRLNVSIQQPLAAWRVSAIADGAVQAEPLGGDIGIATGLAYQHDPIGYGIGFTLNNDGTSGAPMVLGVRDARYAYAKLFNTVNWVQGGQINRVLDPDGIVLDAHPGNGEFLLGATTMRTPGMVLLLAVARTDTALPDRIELLNHQGLDWNTLADPLSVPQLSAIGSGIIDVGDRPVLLTVENFGTGGRGRIRAYQWTY